MFSKSLFSAQKLLLLVATAVVLPSCNQLSDKDKTADSKDFMLNERDSVINEFISSFNDVERSLDSVAFKQHIITANTKTRELQPDQKTRINNEISGINNLMTMNRKRIAELSHRLKNSSVKNIQLEKTIATLNAQLTQKDRELGIMNDLLNQFHDEIIQLQGSVGELQKTVADQNTALHTAYYVIGKSKDLQNSKIINREGGLLGIGKTSKITENVDNKKFTRIDYTSKLSISINSNDVKIITSHPSDSYTLDMDKKKMVKNILISNPEKFWSASKYLVIVKS